LAEYQVHLERFGPECVLETAAGDLPAAELGQLKALVESRERTHLWRTGDWHPLRMEAARLCDECNLELPRNARSNVTRHRRCGDGARKRAYRERREPTSQAATQ
jgi:hypothetical protein